MNLNNSILILFIGFLSINKLNAQVAAYEIYTSKGKKVSFEQMAKSMNQKDFVFFGEYHDNPISHWLELELLLNLHSHKGQNLKLGFEMFEQDQQLLLNQFLEGTISEKQFEDSCRLWPNYYTDYKPLLEFAKEKEITCIASNIPRRYASLLYKKGRSALDTLTELEKSWICPLDFKLDTTLSQYNLLKEMQLHAGGNMVESQAIKDATMAYFLLKEYTSGNLIYHINGTFHTDYFQGIVWYMLQNNPEIKTGTIATVSQDNVNVLLEENKGKADFIICVNNNMTSTH